MSYINYASVLYQNVMVYNYIYIIIIYKKYYYKLIILSLFLLALCNCSMCIAMTFEGVLRNIFATGREDDTIVHNYTVSTIIQYAVS